MFELDLDFFVIALNRNIALIITCIAKFPSTHQTNIPEVLNCLVLDSSEYLSSSKLIGKTVVMNSFMINLTFHIR
jgi:hypothetical protein